MKNFTTLLTKGDLTPKERVLLWVRNQVAKDTTGKEILTEADKQALIKNWKPRDNAEIREYNLYNNGWKTEGSLRLDTQTVYLNAENSLLRASRLVDYALWKDYKKKDDYFDNNGLGVDQDRALDLILDNSGLLHDQTLYRLTFQNISEELRQDIIKLCPDAETESQYLDQEEILADLFSGKDYLTSEAKEKLADLIIESIHNKFILVLKKKRIDSPEWWFGIYFAELPTIEIAKKWAKANEINCQSDGGKLEIELSEKIQNYATNNGVEAREILKAILLDWLDHGLFVDEYKPICHSEEKSTCNDSDTVLPHKEVLKGWLKAKAEAKVTLKRLVETRQLNIKNKERDLYGVKEKVKIITGKSLYKLKGDFSFAEDYRKQADNLKPLGCLIIFLREREFLNNYTSLLAVAEIYKKLSKIYEIDLGYKIKDSIECFGRSIKQLNNELHCVAEELEKSVSPTYHIKFNLYIFLDDILIHLEEIEPKAGEMEIFYEKEFKEILGDKF